MQLLLNMSVMCYGELDEPIVSHLNRKLYELQIRLFVLDVALESFSTSGFDATSLDAIAKSLGIRKQTILYHFTTKKGLLNAVVERAAGSRCRPSQVVAARWRRLFPSSPCR